MSNDVLTHKWDTWAGTPPYRFVAIVSYPPKSLVEHQPNAYNAACAAAANTLRSFGINNGGCMCDNCGMCLMNNCVVKNADGKHFVVGLDCVNKCGDTKLMSAANRAERDRKREIAAKKREAKWEKQRLEQNARLDAEKERNGGLTDFEVADKKRNDERTAVWAARSGQNDWLVDGLSKGRMSDFVESIINDLSTGRSVASDLSDRCLAILNDIYAKAVSDGARRNSKAYEAGYEEFTDKLEAMNEEKPRTNADVVMDAQDRINRATR